MRTIPRPVVLDTDIGTDVDDVFALGTLLGSPEVELVGCTTVYGDIQLRARLAKRMLRLAGRPEVPVVPGERDTLSGLPVKWGGWEGAAQTDLEAEPIDEAPRAVAFLGERAREYAGALDVVVVGPLTNIAAVIRQDPGFAENVHRLYVMGGHFGDGQHPEHNFASDPAAVQTVVGAGIPLTVTGLEITSQSWLGYDELDRVTGTNTDVARFVEAEARNLWTVLDVQGSSPHDPLSLLPIFRPELFEFREVSIDITDTGMSIATPRPGSTRLTVSVQFDEATEEIVRRIRRAAEG